MASWTEFAELASAPVTVTVRGRVRSTEDQTSEWVTFAPPDFWRIADADGTLRFLADAEGRYDWSSGGEVPVFTPRDPREFHWGGRFSPGLINPRALDGDDFTRPGGPVEEVTFLGRPAWRVLLLPPPHKPHPILQFTDVATGITLATQSPDGAYFLGFTELETGIDLPPDAFVPPV
jgi:hypothetical protein